MKRKTCRLGFKHLAILLVIRLLCSHSDNGPLLTLRNKLCYFAVSPSQISFLVFLLSVLSLSQTLFHTAFPHSLPGIGLRRCPTPPPSHTRGTVGACVTFSKFYPSASILDVLCVTHILRRCETNLKPFISSNQSALQLLGWRRRGFCRAFPLKYRFAFERPPPTEQ